MIVRQKLTSSALAVDGEQDRRGSAGGQRSAELARVWDELIEVAFVGLEDDGVEREPSAQHEFGRDQAQDNYSEGDRGS